MMLTLPVRLGIIIQTSKNAHSANVTLVFDQHKKLQVMRLRAKVQMTRPKRLSSLIVVNILTLVPAR